MKNYIFGNWKQNGDQQLLTQMIHTLQALPEQTNQVLAFFPPDVYLSDAHRLLHNTQKIKLGAQNLSAHVNGAYTGEIAGAMLKQVGACFVLIGHSERRQLFAETNVIVAEKFQQALAAGLTPVLCVGETLQEYETGQTTAVIQQQLEAVFDQHEYENHEWIIAYEPIWAIGTGKVASHEQVQTVHTWIRRFFSKTLSAQQAQNTPIIYGGSVKPENAADLLNMSDVNGLLVGGASLEPQTFAAIAQIYP